MATAFVIKPDAMPAWNNLGALLNDLTESGSTTPCQVDPTPFVSDDKRMRDEAVEACASCRVISACAAFAVANGESAYVWGGRDHTATTRKKNAA